MKTDPTPLEPLTLTDWDDDSTLFLDTHADGTCVKLIADYGGEENQPVVVWIDRADALRLRDWLNQWLESREG